MHPLDANIAIGRPENTSTREAMVKRWVWGLLEGRQGLDFIFFLV
jgi:hypothetical protein